jgi:hypothetical protein
VNSPGNNRQPQIQKMKAGGSRSRGGSSLTAVIAVVAIILSSAFFVGFLYGMMPSDGKPSVRKVASVVDQSSSQLTETIIGQPYAAIRKPETVLAIGSSLTVGPVADAAGMAVVSFNSDPRTRSDWQVLESSTVRAFLYEISCYRYRPWLSPQRWRFRFRQLFEHGGQQN